MFLFIGDCGAWIFSRSSGEFPDECSAAVGFSRTVRGVVEGTEPRLSALCGRGALGGVNFEALPLQKQGTARLVGVVGVYSSPGKNSERVKKHRPSIVADRFPREDSSTAVANLSDR